MESEPEVRILIVDDRPDKARALQILIADLGKVITVFSGREALRCLLQQDFALILLDVNMPDMDGFETAAMIRQRPSFERTPIIFITSFHDSDNHASRGYSIGAVDYILAPVIPDVLRAKVSVFADLYRKTHEVKRRAEERLLLLQEQAARGQAEENERRAIFLASASRLLGSSMDTSVLLGSLVKLITQSFTDWCCIDLLGDQGLERRASCKSGIESPQGLALPIREWPIDSEMRTLLIADIKSYASVHPEVREAFAGLPIDSLVIAPVHARGQRMGYMIMARERDGQRRFDNFDAATAEDLAQRIGIALDHASIYHEAQQANRIKDEFLAVVSHELRTPLTPILGWTKILSSNALDVSTMKRGLDVIDRNIKAQSKLIDDLLDISRIITGKLRLNLRKVELQRVIDMALESLRPAALAKSIALETQTDGRLELVIDPSRLQQVLWNLIFNAIKFTPANGTISILWKPVGHQVEIAVSDTGRGISQRFLPFVFDRFRQADSSSTRSDGGLGIGLSITRQIVELHGGTVSVASPGEGKGSVFTVRLPLAIPETVLEQVPSSPQSEKSESRREAPSLKGLHILVVDDNSDARDLLTVLLEQAGARVTTKESAAAGLTVFDEQYIDLLLCDLAMPNEDGFQMIRKVRVHPRGQATPSIALSAYCREQDVQAALKSGFNQHIAKPIEPSELFSSILALTTKRATAHVNSLNAGSEALRK